MANCLLCLEEEQQHETETPVLLCLAQVSETQKYFFAFWLDFFDMFFSPMILEEYLLL